MTYFAYWHLTENGWTPHRVFQFDAEGHIVPDIGFPPSLWIDSWNTAQDQIRLYPEDRRINEISKPEYDLLRAEIDKAGEESVTSITNFVPDAYVGIRGAETSKDWEAVGGDIHPEVAYVRIKRVLSKDNYLVELLGVDTSYKGRLLDILFKEGRSGEPKRVNKTSELKLGRDYVLQFSYGMLASQKHSIQEIREEGAPAWRHQPDVLLDMGTEG